MSTKSKFALPFKAKAVAAAVVASLALAVGAAVPAEASGPHYVTFNVGSCGWDYATTSVQLGVVPSLSSIPYPVSGSSERFLLPGVSRHFTVVGSQTCVKHWWAFWNGDAWVVRKNVVSNPFVSTSTSWVNL